MVPSPYLAFYLDIAVVQGCILQKRGNGNANLNLQAFKISFMKQGKSTRVKREDDPLCP